MKCPNCNMEMEPGQAQVKGTLLGFLIIGFSHQNLYFRSAEGGVNEKIIRSGGKRSGYYCRQCQGLFIEGGRDPWFQWK